MDQQPQSGTFLRFWTTIPGFLTAAAAVITAIGTIYVTSTINHNAVGPTQIVSPPTSTSTVTTVTTAPTIQPDVPVSLSAARLNLDRIDTNSGQTTGVESLISDCENGDDGSCVQIIRILLNDCDQGDGLSCDLLYQVSPAGSDLELFGATCGGRVTTDFADQCRNI